MDFEIVTTSVKNWLDSGAGTAFRLWAGFALIVFGLWMISFAYAVIATGCGLIVWHIAVTPEDDDASGP